MATFDEVMKKAGIGTTAQAAVARKRRIPTDEKLMSGAFIPTVQGVRRIRLESGGFLAPAGRMVKRALGGANLLSNATNPAADAINERKTYKDLE